jgi:hypothetical protein
MEDRTWARRGQAVLNSGQAFLDMPSPASKHGRFNGQPLDCREVFDVGCQQRSLVLDGRSTDQRVGQSQAMRQRKLVDQVNCPLAEVRRDRYHLCSVRGQIVFQPDELDLVAAALRGLDLGRRRDSP